MMSDENSIASNSLPFISVSHPSIAKNQQVNQALVNNLKKALRSEPQKVNCPYCNNYDFTVTQTKRNNCNMAFCIFSLYLPWCITKICRRKDKNFNDAKHMCSRCENELANYDAC